eukprot:scaffold1281_cov90-Isochrysis_galbana.AAC.2
MANQCRKMISQPSHQSQRSAVHHIHIPYGEGSGARGVLSALRPLSYYFVRATLCASRDPRSAVRSCCLAVRAVPTAVSPGSRTGFEANP